MLETPPDLPSAAGNDDRSGDFPRTAAEGQLPPPEGARRATPRSSHGARRAIEATARSERRIVLRADGVGSAGESRFGRSWLCAVGVDGKELPMTWHTLQVV